MARDQYGLQVINGTSSGQTLALELPLFGAERSSSLLADIAGTIEAGLDALGEHLLERATRELAALGPVARLELSRPVKRGVVAVLRDALARLGTDADPPLELPPDTLHAVQLWVRAGLEVSALISACSVLGESFWDEFERAIGVLAPAAGGALEATSSAQRSLSLYSDRLQHLLRLAYHRERELLAPDPESRRSVIVSRILAGAQPSIGELGYEFAQHHLALIAWGEDARERVASVAKDAGRRILSSAGSDGSVWAWIGGSRRFSSDDVDAIVESAQTLGPGMAFGEPGQGIEGFRRSHRQAVQARAAGSATEPETIGRYGQTALLALLRGCDPADARAFVQYELAGLLESDFRSAELRRTLDVLLTHGQRTCATAEALGVDRHTVRDRLDEIEHRIGGRVERRGAELHAALLLLAADL